MKIEIWLDSRANIHSCKETIVDTTDLGKTDEEWKALSEDEKGKLVLEYWADMGIPDFGYRET